MKFLLIFLKREHLYHASAFAYFPHHAFCSHITCAVALITLILLANVITVILLKPQEDFLIVEL
jgi:hypothetical protein